MALEYQQSGEWFAGGGEGGQQLLQASLGIWARATLAPGPPSSKSGTFSTCSGATASFHGVSHCDRHHGLTILSVPRIPHDLHCTDGGTQLLCVSASGQ